MLETKVVLSKFLRRLKVLSRDKSEDLKITFHPVLENYGGIYARLERRS